MSFKKVFSEVEGIAQQVKELAAGPVLTSNSWNLKVDELTPETWFSDLHKKATTWTYTQDMDTHTHAHTKIKKKVQWILALD